MDRFSLLLLEPGEVYFEDFKVVYHIRPEDKQPQIQNEVPGRLKVCSKCAVFVPFSHALPMLKFPLADCDTIEEWTPKSFQSALAYKQEIMFISCKQTVEMLSQSIIAPYKFRRQKETFVFSFTYRKVADCLSQIQQLHRASSLPPVEQNGMLAVIVYSRQSRSSFDTSWIDNLQEKIIMQTVGNKISPLVLNPGRILLTCKRLYFQAYNNLETEPVIKIKLSNIKRIFRRRYLLRPQGLEIEYEGSKGVASHIYLSLTKPEDRDILYDKIIQQENFQASQDEESMTLKWQHGILSNYDYLIYLNSIADRSFNDLTQYPVFPWVIQDYTSPTLDLDSEKTYRDLTKPIGAINKERLEFLKSRREDLPDEKYLYGSHYSTPGFVLYYLVRKVPEYMLCLQNGRFDHPDRMFNSIPTTWKNVTTHLSDFKELVPQFYQQPGDFLTNSMGIDFGVRQDNKKVGDVELPPWALNPEDFVSKLRQALESDYVSKNLHHWIDLIFGYKQRGENAELSDNVFYPLCYEGSVDLDSIPDLEERYGLEVQISEFGQIPKQILHRPHPQRYTSLPRSLVTELSAGKQDYSRSSQWISIKSLVRESDHQSHKEAISALCIYQDHMVVSASQDSQVKLYNLRNCTVERSVHMKTMSISSIICPHKSNSMLLGCWDSTILSYNVYTAMAAPSVPAHSDAVSCLAWSGGRLASGGWDGRIRVWLCDKGEGLDGNGALYELSLGSAVTCVDILYDEISSPDNTNLDDSELSVGPDGCGDTDQTDLDECVNDVGCGWVAGGSREGEVYIWRLEGGRFSLSQQIPAHKRQVNCVLFNENGNRILTGGSDFLLQVHDLETGTSVFRRDIGEEVTALAWDGDQAIVGGGRGSIQIWNLFDNAKIWEEPNAHTGRVTSLVMSQGINRTTGPTSHVIDNKRILVSGGEDRRVIVWKTLQ